MKKKVEGKSKVQMLDDEELHDVAGGGIGGMKTRDYYKKQRKKEQKKLKKNKNKKKNKDKKKKKSNAKPGTSQTKSYTVGSNRWGVF